MPNTAPESWLHVAAGAIVGADGRILIARRAQHRHQGGLWEFPGGKVEDGEGVREALARELWEELHIEVEQARPLIQIRHRYPDKAVLLDVWRVGRFGGAPAGREGQPLAWAAPEALAGYDFPAANAPIVAAVRLPAVLPLAGRVLRLSLPGGALEGAMLQLEAPEGALPAADFMVAASAGAAFDWRAFEALCARAAVPVYAAGLDAAALHEVWLAGGQGVAPLL